MKPEKTYIEIERFFLHNFKEYFSPENQFEFDDDKITFPSCENSTFPDLIKRVINYSKLNSQELLPDLLALKNLYENSAVHTLTFNDLMTYYTESSDEILNNYKILMNNIVSYCLAISNSDYYRKFLGNDNTTMRTSFNYTSIYVIIDSFSDMHFKPYSIYKNYVADEDLLRNLETYIKEFRDNADLNYAYIDDELYGHITVIESDIEELNEQIQKLENTANELKNNIDKFLDIFNTSNGEYPIELTDYFQNLKHIDRHSICNIIGYDYSNKFESVMKFINPKID